MFMNWRRRVQSDRKELVITINNHGASPEIKTFGSKATVEQIIDFLNELDFQTDSFVYLVFYCNNKVLFLKS